MAPMRRAARSSFVERETFISLMLVHESLKSQMEALLAGHGLSEPQFNALRILRGAGPRGLPSQQIAERLITRQPDVTRLVDRLCAAGLVKRQPCKEDRRVTHVRLTAAGRKTLARLDRPVDALHRRQFAHMPRGRVALLGELLTEAGNRE